LDHLDEIGVRLGASDKGLDSRSVIVLSIPALAAWNQNENTHTAQQGEDCAVIEDRRMTHTIPQ